MILSYRCKNELLFSKKKVNLYLFTKKTDIEFIINKLQYIVDFQLIKKTSKQNYAYL